MIYKAEHGQTLKAFDVDYKEYIKGVYEVDTDNRSIRCIDESSKESVIRYRLITANPNCKPIEFYCDFKIDEEEEAMKEFASACMKKFIAFREAGFSEKAALELCQK